MLNADQTALLELLAADRDAVVASTVHNVLWLLRRYALTEGGGAVTEYELGQLLRSVARDLRRLASEEEGL